VSTVQPALLAVIEMLKARAETLPSRLPSDVDLSAMSRTELLTIASALQECVPPTFEMGIKFAAAAIRKEASRYRMSRGVDLALHEVAAKLEGKTL
jgi:hypothetical protein